MAITTRKITEKEFAPLEAQFEKRIQELKQREASIQKDIMASDAHFKKLNALHQQLVDEILNGIDQNIDGLPNAEKMSEVEFTFFKKVTKQEVRRLLISDIEKLRQNKITSHDLYAKFVAISPEACKNALIAVAVYKEHRLLPTSSGVALVTRAPGSPEHKMPEPSAPPLTSRHAENMIRYYQEKIEATENKEFKQALRDAYAPEFEKLRRGEITTTKFSSESVQNDILEQAKRLFDARHLAAAISSSSGTALAMQGLSAGAGLGMKVPSAPDSDSDDELQPGSVSHTAKTAPSTPEKRSPELKREDNPPREPKFITLGIRPLDPEKLRLARSINAAAEKRKQEEAAEKARQAELKKQKDLDEALEAAKPKKKGFWARLRS